MAKASEQAETPVAMRRETLSSRAKRVIGRELDTICTGNARMSDPEDEEGAAVGALDRKGPPRKPLTRRREQILTAQRVHRQRTQCYIKELEAEVLKLREEGSDLKKKEFDVHQQLHLLERHMLENNFGFPLGYQICADTKRILDQVSSSFSIGPAGNLTPPLQTGNSSSGGGLQSQVSKAPQYWPCALSAGFDSWPQDASTLLNVDFSNLSTAMKGFSDTHYGTTTVDPSPAFIPAQHVFVPHRIGDPSLMPATPRYQNALDFVLGLENVCLPHLKNQYTAAEPEPLAHSLAVTAEDNWGPHHAYMATTNLLNHHFSPSSRTHNTPPLSTSEPFTITGIDLEYLLKTSLQMDFGDDVTPVQIWWNLDRLQRKGWNIDGDVLKRLEHELNKHKRCNGFGAVVAKETVKLLFTTFFPDEIYQDVPHPI